MAPSNPRHINRQSKDATINQNILYSGYGTYQMCPWKGSLRVKYNKDFNRRQTNTICKVMVKHLHALDIVGGLSAKGLGELKTNNPYPVIINPMYREFNGNNANSDRATADENINLRTNFIFIAKRQDNIFPTTTDTEIVLTSPVTVIRDAYYNEIPHEKLYRTGLITVAPPKPELIEKIVKDGDRHEKFKVLSSKHLFKLQSISETAFQVAAMNGHNAIIISLFDQEFGIPIDDQILIYNYCILKYGHFFTAIIFAIPPYQPQDIVTYIDEKVVKPQNIATDAEMSYKSTQLNRKFELNNMEIDHTKNDMDSETKHSKESSRSHGKGKSKMKSKSNMNTDVATMTDSEKMMYLKNAVKKKRAEIQNKMHKSRSKVTKSRSKKE